MPGVDSGAVNETYGVTEADIVKEIGAGVQQYLNRVGYDCMLVQSDNLCGESPNYTNICASANGWKADLFLSIHCNAAAEEAQGTETLVYSRDSKGACALAECIQNQIVQSLSTVDRGVKERPGHGYAGGSCGNGVHHQRRGCADPDESEGRICPCHCPRGDGLCGPKRMRDHGHVADQR